MKLIEILSINLKYYCMHYNLSQENFAADFYDYNDFGINFESYGGSLTT